MQLLLIWAKGEWTLPEVPVTATKNVCSQTKIGNRMRKNALGNAPGGVIDTVKNHPRHDPGKNIVMLQSEEDADGNKWEQAEPPDRDCHEVSVDQVAQQERSPEQLLHDRHNDHRTSDSDDNH